MGPFNQYDTGPNAGQTPEDASDLHTSANPYAASSPATDLSDDTRRNFTITGPGGGPAGPYYNPPPSVGTNPFRDGSGRYTSGEQQVADDLAAGLSNVYGEQFGLMAGHGEGGQPPDINYDEGFGRSGTGRS